MAANEHGWAVRAACVSYVGQVRRQNEDNYLVAIEHGLFIVSDGMSGHQAGEVASKVVVTVLPTLLEQRMARIYPPSTIARELVLRDSIVELSQRLRGESTGRMGLQGMGATVALAWLNNSAACLAHLGDSRIYLFRQEHLQQLTENHFLWLLYCNAMARSHLRRR
jgi:PPM family protein phosphatase